MSYIYPEPKEYQVLKRGKKEIAQKLKKQKIPAKQIAEITGLSEVEIENLK